jgi:hypothetical protein
MRQFIYKDLIDLDFKRFDMGDGFDLNGYEDFYLFLEINKTVSFEWNTDENHFVKMVRYKGSDVQNVIKIFDMENLSVLLSFFREKQGNTGDLKLKTIEKISNLYA